MRAENKITVVFGTKGHGKSTYAIEAFRERVRRGGRAVWIDSVGKFGWLGRQVSGPAAWWRVVRPELEAGRGFGTVVTPGWGEELGAEWWRMLYEVGGLLLVLDDCQGYASANYIAPGLGELVAKARNREVDIITTVRTPPELHMQFRDNADVVVSFRLAQRRRAEDVARTWFELEPRAADLLHRLPRFHYLRADADGVTAGRVRPG